MPNPIQRRQDQIRQEYQAFITSDAKVLHWLFKSDEKRMLEAFVTIESVENKTGDCILPVTTPFEEKEGHGLAIVDGLDDLMDSMKEHLEKAEVHDPVWIPPELPHTMVHYKNAPAPDCLYLSKALQSLQQFLEPHTKNLSLVLEPSVIINSAQWQEWLNEFIPLLTQKKVRLIPPDNIEEPIYSSIAAKNKTKVQTQKANLDMPKAMEEMAREAEDANEPSGQFRWQFVQMSNAIGKKDLSEARNKAAQAEAIAKKNQWLHMEFAVHQTMANAELGAERVGKTSRIQYFYNARDMLVRIETATKNEYEKEWTDDKKPWTAEYDALGRRICCGFENQQTYFYWNENQLVAEISPEGNLRIYGYACEESLVPLFFIDYESIRADPETGKVYSILVNQVGMPVAVEDINRNIVWESVHSDPYGSLELCKENKIELNLRWPGHYYDQTTGLHYNRFRYYDPRLGRYLQEDPIGQKGGVNTYAYPANPLKHVDVYGLSHANSKTSRNSNDGGETAPTKKGSPKVGVEEARVRASSAVKNKGDGKAVGHKKGENTTEKPLEKASKRHSNPLDDPKIAKEIKVDPDAVYGYSPIAGSPLNQFKVDWHDKQQVGSARQKRIAYHEKLRKEGELLRSEVKRMQEQGMSFEDIARQKVHQRNQERINSYIKDNNMTGLESMKQRNLQEYGREEGPTPEQLFEKKGSWEEVIFGTVKTSAAMDVLTGLY